MDNLNELKDLLNQTNKFKESLVDEFNCYSLVESPQADLVLSTFEVALEHSIAINLLISNVLATTGLAVLRLQYDAVVRLAWLQYAALDSEIQKLSMPLNKESAQKIKNWLPSTNDMLAALDGKAHPRLIAHLKSFREYSSHALNSYVHAGIHAISRQKSGYRTGLVTTAIQQSNNLIHMAAIMLSEQYQNEALSTNILKFSKTYQRIFQFD